MSAKWPLVKLGVVLKQVDTSVPADQLATVQLAGVYSFGRGLFKRGDLDTAGTSYKKYNRLVTNDFVISQPKAWEGALALVTEEFNGWFLSPVFPTFRAVAAKLDPRYLSWWCKKESVWASLLFTSRGIGARRETVSPEGFLALEIPLPPLPEQRRLVARIEALAALVAEAKALRKEAVEEAEALWRAQCDHVFSSLSEKHGEVEFGKFKPHVTSGPRNWGRHYQDAGARFYRAQDIGPNGEMLTANKVFIEPPPGGQGRSAMPQPGDLLLVITGATVGRVTLYRRELEPGFVSQHVAICRLPQDAIEPDFALWALRSPSGQEQLLGSRYGQGKPGLNLTNIRSLKIPLPALPTQRRIVQELDALQTEVEALRNLQAATAAELDALMGAVLGEVFVQGKGAASYAEPGSELSLAAEPQGK